MIRVTDDTLPVICLQSFGESNFAEIAQIRPIYERAYAAGKPVICISDARFASHSAEQRKLWAEWTAETIEADKKQCVLATVVMLDNPLLRGALTALNWLTPPQVPQAVVGDVTGALEAAREIAERHGVEVPAHVWGHARFWLDSGRRKAHAELAR